jgi:hypothetical protein
MRLRFFLVVELLLVLACGLTTQAYGASCREAQRIRGVYWQDMNSGHPSAANDVRRQNEWAFGGGCGANSMYGYGDYDRDHHWHDSDWWYGHDRDWVHKHHPTWVESSEHHDWGHHDEGPGHHDEGPGHHDEGPGHHDDHGPGHDDHGPGHDHDQH